MTENGLIVQTWTAPAVKFDAVQLTPENIEEVARWVGADFTEVITNLKTQRCEVSFTLKSERDSTKRGDRILYAIVGQYITRQNAHVDEFGDVVQDRYYALNEENLWAFKKDVRAL